MCAFFFLALGGFKYRKMKTPAQSPGKGYEKFARKTSEEGMKPHPKVSYISPPMPSSPSKKRHMDIYNDIGIEVSPPKLRRQVASAWLGSETEQRRQQPQGTRFPQLPSTGPFQYEQQFANRTASPASSIISSIDQSAIKNRDLIGDDECSLFADAPTTSPRPRQHRKTTVKDKKLSYYNRSEGDLYSLKNLPHFSRPFGSRRRMTGLFHRSASATGPCGLAIPEYVPGLPSVRKVMTHELSTLSL